MAPRDLTLTGGTRLSWWRRVLRWAYLRGRA
jgi:hypothetical protein